MIQERRGMLKVWGVVLIWFTWELTLIGTFLTRSGVVQSVHAFALSPIGPLFAVFVVSTLVGFLALLVWRLPLLRSDNQLDAILSRETSFLTQNVVFLLIMFATLLGTLFPIVSEWITGDKIALNAPYFQRVNGPMFALLLVLMGAAPLLAWRRSAPETLRRNFVIPIGAALLLVPVAWLLGNRNPAGFLGFSVLGFVLAGIVQEYVRGVKARQSATGEPVVAALVNLVRRNGRRYGGYIVHVGVIMIALGIIGNTFYQSQGQANLRRGESMTVANYTLTYRQVDDRQGPNYTEYVASVDVSRDGHGVGQILPKKVVYNKSQDQPMTVVGLRTGPIEDVYVVLADFSADGSTLGTTASFKVFVNPLMAWMWAGGIMLILGVLVSTWPRGARAVVEARVRAAGTARPA
jgi:cytochrome c-type biogenesis protein CcmF